MSKEQYPSSGRSLEFPNPPGGTECPTPSSTVPSVGRSTTGRQAPSTIVFEERDGLYWLRGDNLDRAKTPLGLRCDSPSVGFDRFNWSVYVADLAKKRIPIGVVRGNTIFTVRFNSKAKALHPDSTSVDLMPDQLVGRNEIERLASCLTQKHSRVGELVRNIRAQAAKNDRNAWTDPGVLYAYQVVDDIYEVDWDLTRISHPTVEALLIAAHLERQPVPCQVVLPKPRRERHAIRSAAAIELSEPVPYVPYGQLRLPL